MAGHSKWANIQHRKKAQDAKRGKLFTKLIRKITVAARKGGGDADSNPHLRTAIDEALSNNMTRDTIDRAIKRGSGSSESDMMEEIRYEGYGPSGVAVLVYCLTDNRNRTVAEVRHVFTKCGGNLGTDGSVAYLFNKKGLLTFPPGSDENRIIEVALEAGAEDIVTNDDGSLDVLTQPENFHSLQEMLLQSQLQPAFAEISMIASTEVNLDEENAEKMLRLIEMLEDLDDVQDVYSNAKISEEILEKLQ